MHKECFAQTSVTPLYGTILHLVMMMMLKALTCGAQKLWLAETTPIAQVMEEALISNVSSPHITISPCGAWMTTVSLPTPTWVSVELLREQFTNAIAAQSLQVVVTAVSPKSTTATNKSMLKTPS
jgi:hypothetical protein